MTDRHTDTQTERERERGGGGGRGVFYRVFPSSFCSILQVTQEHARVPRTIAKLGRQEFPASKSLWGEHVRNLLPTLIIMTGYGDDVDDDDDNHHHHHHHHHHHYHQYYRTERRTSRLFFCFVFFFFNNFLTAPRTVSNTNAQVARVQSCANHVQHIQRLSRETCRVTCHVVRRDSSAIKFDRV